MLDVVAPTFSANKEGQVDLWSTEREPGQPGLQGKTLPQTETKQAAQSLMALAKGYGSAAFGLSLHVDILAVKNIKLFIFL